MDWTKTDLEQIQKKGKKPEELESQLMRFREGFPFMNLVKPATPGHGINQLSEEETDELLAYYDQHAAAYSIIKFVPASGAASRMFTSLFTYLDASVQTQKQLLEAEQKPGDLGYFFKHIQDFAFYSDLEKWFMSKQLRLSDLILQKKYPEILKGLLSSQGLNYGSLPKGLLKFHKYPDKSTRMGFEEHLVEAAHYARNKEGNARIEFTVSPEHLDGFTEAMDEVLPGYTQKYGLEYQISFSQQKSSTDTLAADPENNPFRNSDGSLLFRPGGHGALIENLNELDADLVFIKNIDNVVPDRIKHATFRHKKAIGGLLLKTLQQVFEHLELLEHGRLSQDEITEIRDFAEFELNITIPDGFEYWDALEQIDLLYEKLNRPIRVCGMVKNEGEPGGGPFWVRSKDQELSLQIVESSQVNPEDEQQQKILSQSTHFNPVDLVCSLKNYKGEAFDLLEFVDPDTGFISEKSKDGRPLKAMELPGLWNGAMADWNTLFVEVPIDTFNPVKTIHDLLRPNHL